MVADSDIFVSPEDPKPKYPVKYGHANRYDLPDPVTGKQRLWTRVSTIVGTLKDRYHLNKWERRVIVKGMSMRPDLAMLAANLDVSENKKELNSIAEKAKDTAGGNKGANMGTALHDYAERLDGGATLVAEHMTIHTKKSLIRYQQELKDNDIQVLPNLMEKVVCIHELGVCGRLDRVLTSRWWDMPRIGDLKTQQSMDFGYMEVAMQEALYSRANYMYNEDTGEWDPFPEIDQFKGLVMHLPAEQDFCEFHEVDLDSGWECVKLAMTLRMWRKRGKYMGNVYVNDFAWRARIVSAKTVADLSAVWRDAMLVGEWSKSLEELGLKHRQIIQGNVNG